MPIMPMGAAGRDEPASALFDPATFDDCRWGLALIRTVAAEVATEASRGVEPTPWPNIVAAVVGGESESTRLAAVFRRMMDEVVGRFSAAPEAAGRELWTELSSTFALVVDSAHGGQGDELVDTIVSVSYNCGHSLFGAFAESYLVRTFPDEHADMKELHMPAGGGGAFDPIEEIDVAGGRSRRDGVEGVAAALDRQFRPRLGRALGQLDARIPGLLSAATGREDHATVVYEKVADALEARFLPRFDRALHDLHRDRADG